ncbi:MAG: glycosyltransferase [Verrucomicrobiota bacterium JB025]|nr:glycosyltransferase [Verrucomicrobiota bacterium JB025]
MTDDPTIAAVFATMNRAQTALSCVEALAAQTRPPALVVVADNVSTDDTVARLNALTKLPFALVVHTMLENGGNAGGVSDAMELAFDRGADAVWILDDDSWPRPDALAAMLAKPLDPDVVRHPLQIDPHTGRFTWPLQARGADGQWMLIEHAEDLPDGDFVPTRINWTGALVTRKVRETIGPVNAGLFIRGEDEEYPWRIEQAGFTQEAATLAIMEHPGPQNIRQWHFAGKSLFFEQGLSDWKLYYKIRNMVWLKRRQSGGFGALTMAAAYAAAAVRFDGIHRLPLVREAVSDGWYDRLGKWNKHPA